MSSLSAESQNIIDVILKRFDENESRIMSEIATLKEGNAQLRNKCDVLEKRLETQDETILQMERRLNRNNVIIYGIDEKEMESELAKNIVEVLNTKLEIDINKGDIEQVYRIGKRKINESPRPIRLLLINNIVKNKIVQTKSKLKGTKIFINDDLPKTLRIREAEKRRKRMESNGKTINKRLMGQSSEEMDDDLVDKRITQEPKKLNYGAVSIDTWLGQRNDRSNEKN